MKHWFVYLIIVASSTVDKCFAERARLHERNVKCTETMSNILWPDYENPQLYYICTHNGMELHEMLCHDTQKFNFYLQKCVDDPEWITAPKPEDIFTLTEDEDYCSDGSGLWVDDQEKGHYLLCIDVFNAVKIRSKRSVSMNIEGDLQATDELNLFAPSCNQHEYGLLWPDPISVEHFFRCLDVEHVIREKCPDGHLFQFRIQMCTVMTLTTPTIEQRAPSCSDNQLDSRWPDAWDSRNYFICRSIGEFTKLQCPIGSTFQFQIQMCVVNPNFSTTTIGPSSTTQIGQSTTRNPFDPLVCNNEDLHLLWPVINDPHGFSFCAGLGQPSRRNCPQVMIFVFELQTCVDNPNFTTPTQRPTTL